DVPADATPFDMRGVDLSHHGGDCSFETFLRRYSLEDPVLWDLARIVHEADLADERFDAPEAKGLDVALRRLSLVRPDDEILGLAASGLVFGLTTEFAILFVVALTGTLSTEVVESGPFTSLEQAMLPSGLDGPSRTRVFGVYNAVATVAGSFGALAAGGPSVL